MKEINYHRHRFSSHIIQYAVLLYCKYSLSYRDIEDILAERNIIVSYETIRRWVLKFGYAYCIKIKKHNHYIHCQWHLDEVFIRVCGKQMYLWRAVDQCGEVLDIMVSEKRDTKAAAKFLRQLINKYGEPKALVTDKLAAYKAAVRELDIKIKHYTAQWQNNRAELSYQPRQKERQCRKFKDPSNTEQFLSIHATIYNHFNTRRHQITANKNRELRQEAFCLWREATKLMD